MDFLKDLSIDNIRNLAEDAFNQAKPKNDVETRVYEVLSHKNWGASSSIMNEIARDTYESDRFPQVTRLMWDALENQRPAAWRVVFKGLSLLEHLIKNGSERCVDDARNHAHTIKSLHQFNYYEGTIDRGHGVREKSKQIAEIMGDDERIREERQKAKKLRERFGASGSTASSGGGGGGGQYPGYGNDDSVGWGGSGGGGGYGDSRSGGNGYGDDSGKFSGRYSDESAVRASGGGTSSAPTFASMPEVAPKKKKKKKKPEVAEVATPAPAPEIDLFSFDAPASVSVAADDFDAFQSAPAPAVVADPFAASNSGSSDFGNFNSAPAAFQFDAFGVQAQQQQPVNPMMGGNSNAFNAFGNNMPQQGMMNTMNGGGMMGGIQQSFPTQMAATSGGGDDDFGDFEDAVPAAAAISSSTKSDPLNKLISLDGLTKNTATKNKNPNMMNQPIAANQAAQQYLQFQQQAQAQGTPTLSMNPAMSFRGLDGLNKPMNFGVVHQSGPALPVMGGSNVTAGGSDMISMMGPGSVQGQTTPQQQQQQMGQMTAQQMMFAQQQMMAQQMMLQQQMQQGGMMPNQQAAMAMGGMTPQMGMQGGMNPQMGGINLQMGQQGMMNQGMGQQQFNNNNNNNMMGGQPMGGWR